MAPLPLRLRQTRSSKLRQDAARSQQHRLELLPRRKVMDDAAVAQDVEAADAQAAVLLVLVAAVLQEADAAVARLLHSAA